MDLTKLTIIELWKLYYQLSFEIFKRIWWILIIVFVISYLQIIKGNITRSGSCKKCGKYHTEKAKFELIANLKFNLWLYRHYRKEHNENILIELIKRS